MILLIFLSSLTFISYESDRSRVTIQQGKKIYIEELLKDSQKHRSFNISRYTQLGYSMRS